MKQTFNFTRTLIIALWQDTFKEGLNLRAMGLVYTTLLSLVPLLALSFSVLKGFGVHNQLEPLLLNVMTPLGEKGIELTAQILGFVDNVKVGVLGFTGLAILVYTVVSLMRKIEEAFNHTWRVNKGRTLTEQFRDYLSVIMIGPILMFSAVGLSASIWRSSWIQTLSDIEPFGTLLSFLIQYSPTLLIILAFTFIYRFVPNTKVQLRAAFIGAVIAAVLWQIAGWGFTTFIVKSGQQTAIYSVFASLFMFILWLYIGWLILLSGSNIAYYIQNPRALLLAVDQGNSPSPQAQHLIAMSILREVQQRFEQQQAPADVHMLQKALRTPNLLLEPVIERLITQGMLHRDDQQPCHYLPTCSAEQCELPSLQQLFWEGDDLQKKQTQQLVKTLGLGSDNKFEPKTLSCLLNKQNVEQEIKQQDSIGSNNKKPDVK